MDFMQALDSAVSVIREQGGKLDEIYLYERNSQTQVYLKDCEGSLQFDRDESLPPQIFLASFLNKRLQGTSLSLEVIFSCEWEVRLRKTAHLRVIQGKASEIVDYAPVGKEEVADV